MRRLGSLLTREAGAQVLVGAYGSDAVRYYFAKEVEFGRDGDFSEERFRNIVNANLAKESAQLQALQTKQQLGIQALSIANSGSSALLSLFR